MQPLIVYTEQVIVMVCFLILRYDHIYLCVTDVDKNSAVLQDGETMAFKWVTAGELRGMSRDELATMRPLNLIGELT